MPLSKPIADLKTAVFLSHYRRPEYTELAIEALKRAQEYPNVDFYIIEDDNPNLGLRNRLIDFFNEMKLKDYDLLAKMDNDCIVPANWLDTMAGIMAKTDVDILCPNVMPSNAAMRYGRDDKENKGYRPGEVVGGLWLMKSSLIKDMIFEKCGTYGLTGAVSIMKQIYTEMEPVVGWTEEVVVEDIGHWSGQHPQHIKSVEHEIYSKEIGRQVAWTGR